LFYYFDLFDLLIIVGCETCLRRRLHSILVSPVGGGGVFYHCRTIRFSVFGGVQADAAR
jgi:hypothetical protein